MMLSEVYMSAAYESITANTTAVGFTAAKIASTNGGQIVGALVSCETAQVRFTLDGTTVNASTSGHLLNSGDIMEVWGGNDLKNFKAIRTGATNGALKVTYYQA